MKKLVLLNWTDKKAIEFNDKINDINKQIEREIELFNDEIKRIDSFLLERIDMPNDPEDYQP